DVAGHAAQIASLDGSVEINDRLDVVVGDHRHSRSALDGSEACEKGRRGVGSGSGDRHVREILQRVDAVLRGLGRDLVADSILRIEPVCWGSLEAAAKRDQYVLRYGLGVGAD